MGRVKDGFRTGIGDFNDICNVLLLMLDVYFTILLCYVYAWNIFNVFKVEISGYKDTDQPPMESLHYDTGDVPGGCLGSSCPFCQSILCWNKEGRKETLSVQSDQLSVRELSHLTLRVYYLLGLNFFLQDFIYSFDWHLLVLLSLCSSTQVISSINYHSFIHFFNGLFTAP